MERTWKIWELRMVDLNPVLSPCEPTVLTTTSPLCPVSKRFLSNIHCSMNELAMTWVSYLSKDALACRLKQPETNPPVKQYINQPINR